MPEWIHRLHELRPGLHVQLREMPRPDVGRLRSGEADLLVDYLPEIPDDIATMRVGTLRGFLVMPSTHRLARRKRVPLSEFEGDTFISYNPDLHPYPLQMQALAEHGVVPEQIISASSVEAILGFVESGVGFSLVPSLEPDGPSSTKLVSLPLRAPKVEFPVVAAWRKDTPENPLLDAALETAPKG